MKGLLQVLEAAGAKSVHDCYWRICRDPCVQNGGSVYLFGIFQSWVFGLPSLEIVFGWSEYEITGRAPCHPTGRTP